MLSPAGHRHRYLSANISPSFRYFKHWRDRGGSYGASFRSDAPRVLCSGTITVLDRLRSGVSGGSPATGEFLCCRGGISNCVEKQDWSTFIGPFGQQSWLRFGNENGRLEVGLLFMLNILRLDPPAFQAYQEEFISVFFSVIGTDKVSVEHRFLSALLRVPGISIHPVFAGVDDVWQPSAGSDEMSREEFFELRLAILKGQSSGLFWRRVRCTSDYG